MYNRTALRQIVLVMDNEQYAQVLGVFKRIAERERLSTNTEVALYLINRYEADQLNGAPSGAMPEMPRDRPGRRAAGSDPDAAPFDGEPEPDGDGEPDGDDAPEPED